MATVPQLEVSEVHHLALKPPPEMSALAMARAPQLVLEEAARAAQALRQVIETKPNKCVINGKTFLQFEDWQTLGRFYGITAAARSTNYIEYGRVRGFECHAEALLVSTDQVISGAQAMCLDDEKHWKDSPLFQLRSMAQTRAQAKALRNVLAWVVVLAGYAPTPAEEMDSLHAPAARPALAPKSGPGLPNGRMQANLSWLRAATSMAQLKTVFTAAYREAEAVKDYSAMAAYIQTKDVRKAELR